MTELLSKYLGSVHKRSCASAEDVHILAESAATTGQCNDNEMQVEAANDVHDQLREKTGHFHRRGRGISNELIACAGPKVLCVADGPAMA